MAVFTPVTDADARGLLQNYELGELLSLRGISAGIENTNYFLTTTTGEYVLTLFEVLTYEQLPFYIELMHHLAQKGVPVPSPQTLKNGERLTKLNDKPCAIVSRLAGSFVPEPNPTHCALAAQTLAKTHLAAQDYDIYQPNLRSLPWWEKTIPTILTIIAYTICFFFFSHALKSIPLGIAYAIWGGLGIVLSALISVVIFKQSLDLPALIGITLIVAGVFVMNFFSKSAVH